MAWSLRWHEESVEPGMKPYPVSPGEKSPATDEELMAENQGLWAIVGERPA